MIRYLPLAILTFLFISCKKTDTQPGAVISPCMQAQINAALAHPKGYVLFSIDAYNYQGKTVYFYYAGCCDKYNEVKDEDCNFLFAPSGGVGGNGDHTHPNFFTEATFISNVWTDPRP